VKRRETLSSVCSSVEHQMISPNIALERTHIFGDPRCHHYSLSLSHHYCCIIYLFICVIYFLFLLLKEILLEIYNLAKLAFSSFFPLVLLSSLPRFSPLLLCPGSHYCFGKYFISFNTSAHKHLTTSLSLTLTHSYSLSLSHSHTRTDHRSKQLPPAVPSCIYSCRFNTHTIQTLRFVF